MSTAPQRIRRRPGWLAVIGTSLAMFFVVLGLLWVRVSSGADPVLGAQASSAQTSGATTASSTSSSWSGTTSSSSDTTRSTSTATSSVPTTHAS